MPTHTIKQGMEGAAEQNTTLLEILSGGCSHGPVQPSICTCASILMQLRNPKVNLVQAMLSVVLKVGHANTQVIVVVAHDHAQRDTPLNNVVTGVQSLAKDSSLPLTQIDTAVSRYWSRGV